MSYDHVKEYIINLTSPKTQTESANQFRYLYEQVPIQTWLNSDLVFELGNVILHHRPDLLSLGIRLNVQVNLFLRTIKKYAIDNDILLETIGHKLGCFALTEEKAGVLSGLIVDTYFEEYNDHFILTTEDSCKNWISQGYFADYCIVYATNKTCKSDTRIFLVDMTKGSDNGIIRTPIKSLDINNTLDMTKIRFNNVKIPHTALLEWSTIENRIDLLNGIFYGRYMITEATVSAMIGFIEHIECNICESEETIAKFRQLGFLDYLMTCHIAYNRYKTHLESERKNILSNNNVFLVNCYKIYIVEKSMEVFNTLNMMFGMRAVTSKLTYDNLLLHKVTEGDTYVLRVSLINSHFKSGIIHMLSTPGFSFKQLTLLTYKSISGDKSKKYTYIMDNFKEISDTIIHANIPQLAC
jgi:hypothetical protein